MTTAIRVTVLLTHPVQYFSPWFRQIARDARDIALTVVYATHPTPAQQGTGFGRAFAWDVDLLDGYRSVVIRDPRIDDCFSSDDLGGVNVDAMPAIIATRPDVVVIPGWHSITYIRALVGCRLAGIPVLYRGDTHLLGAPGGWRRPAWGLRTRLFLALFDGYLSVGHRSRAYLEHFRCPDPVIARSPHSVDNAFFAASAAPWQAPEARAAARAEWGAGPDDFVVLYVGKLVSLKRPDDLLGAVARLGPHAVLVLAGDGPLRESLLAHARGVGVRVVAAGFLNQRDLGRAYAAADCLALVSGLRHETWGLVVNEAMATGLPVVVTDAVGCGPDLVEPGVTGEVAPTADVVHLGDALARVRDARAAGHDFAPACRARIAQYSFERATEALVAVARRVLARRRGVPAPDGRTPRVMACCGSMVMVSGVERMTFEVLRVVAEAGGTVHCVVNTWDSSRIVALAEEIGATWSTSPYRYGFQRRSRNPLMWLQLAWDILRTSAGLLVDSRRFRPTHVVLPDFTTALRNAPALAVLRARGARVVLRLGNAPDPGAFYRRLWRFAIDPFVDAFVANSDFTRRALLDHGIASAKVRRVYNTVPSRAASAADAPARDPHRVIYVGQTIPEKGLDLLLDAVARLRADGIPATVDIVGNIDGWESPSHAGYRAGLRARAAQPDLAGHVRFLGVREDVPALLAQAAVHCCPSRPECREGFGIVTIEAKRAGIPSVVCRSGALPEVVEHRVDGWVCDEAAAPALAEGLGWFLADPERCRAAGAAARRSEHRFSRASFVAGWYAELGVSA